MKTPKKQTGLRLCADQIEKLDAIVVKSNGRRDRSDLIREAIDNFLNARTPAEERQALQAA